MHGRARSASDRGRSARVLDRAIALATAEDVDALCAIGAGNCESILNDAGRDVPEVPPRIIGTRIHPSTENSIGGVVLELCGTLDSGDAYYTEMLVFRDLIRGGGIDGLHAIEPIYWSGIGIADDRDVGGEPIDPDRQCGAGALVPRRLVSRR